MSTLNPRVDFAFKKLFGSEENTDILIALINAIVSEEDQVAAVTIMNPYNNKDRSYDKLSVLDIKAVDTRGRRFNIEMQITDQVYYNQRALYYWSKLYTSQLKVGDAFGELKKTISINILNFNYFGEEPDYHNVFKILNARTHKSYFDDLELHFIELQKFDNELSHIKTALDRWAAFLKKAHKYDENSFPQELAAEPAIQKAFHNLTHIYMNDEELELYEARLKWLRDEAAAIEKAQLKGEQRGIEKGIEQSMRQVAEKLIRRGVFLEAVAEDTGLSLAQLKIIKDSF